MKRKSPGYWMVDQSKRASFKWICLPIVFLSSLVCLGLLAVLPDFLNLDLPAQAKSQRIDQADRVLSKTRLLDTRSLQRFRAMPLPDIWDETATDFEGWAIYRIRWQGNADEFASVGPDPELSVLLTKVVMNAEIFVNGQRVGGLGRMEGELTRNWNRPFFLTIPKPMLNLDSENFIDIQVAGYANYRSGLGRFWIGPRSELEPHYRRAVNWQINGSMSVAVVSLLASLLLLASSRILRENRASLFIGLAVMFWVIRNIGYFSNEVPLPHEAWAELAQLMYVWFAYFYIRFLLLCCELEKRWILSLLLAHATVFTLSVLLFASASIRDFTVLMLTPLVPIALILSLVCMVQGCRQTSLEKVITGCISALFCIWSLRDLVQLMGLIPYESLIVSQYSGLLAFVTAALVLISRHRDALVKLSLSNERLNQRLSEREAELMKQFNQIREIQNQRTQERERRRIMQDIHDGVGSSLVSAINQCQLRPLSQEEMQEVLTDCLDDLRFAIDSLDPESNDLLALLGNFRWRFEKRLKVAGLKLVWQVEDVPSLEGYSSREIFDLLRIMQEAFANIIKHAKATQISLSIRREAPNSQWIEIMIQDNGVGMHHSWEHPHSTGRGMQHMKQRASNFAGTLSIVSRTDGPGTELRLRLPIVKS